MNTPVDRSSADPRAASWTPRHRSVYRPLRVALLGTALVLLLNTRVQGCLFLDVLTGLYTGTYTEFSACRLDEEGSNCRTLEIAHEACAAEKGIGHAECRALFESIFDCAFCDFFFAESNRASSTASIPTNQKSSALADASPEIFWTKGSAQVLRTLDGGTAVEEIFDAGRWPLGIAMDAVTEKVYWTDGRTRSLRRANLDGSDVEQLVGDLYGSGLALDAAAQMLYFGNPVDGAIERLNLSTMETDIVVAETFSPVDLVFDPADETLYWTRMDPGGGGSIHSLDIGGLRDLKTLVTGLTLPFGLALDSGAGMLYWSDPADNTIRKLDLGNPPSSIDVLTGLNRPGTLALDASSGTLYWADVGTARLNRAGIVDPANSIQTVNGFTAVADLALDGSGDRI